MGSLELINKPTVYKDPIRDDISHPQKSWGCYTSVLRGEAANYVW